MRPKAITHAQRALPGFALWFGLALAAGCGARGSQTQSGSSTSAGSEKSAAMHEGEGCSCPMHAEMEKPAVVDTDSGVALVFTTAGSPDELRNHVRKMAEMHNEHRGGEHGKAHEEHGHGMARGHEEGHGHGKGHGGPGGKMECGAMEVDSTASEEDIEGGARLLLTPKDVSQRDALRSEIREHVEQMGSAECPMHEHGRHGDCCGGGQHEGQEPAQGT